MHLDCGSYVSIVGLFFSDGRGKIMVSQRYDVPARIVQGGQGGKAHPSEGTKKWEQQGCEVLLDAREAQVTRMRTSQRSSFQCWVKLQSSHGLDRSLYMSLTGPCLGFADQHKRKTPISENGEIGMTRRACPAIPRCGF